MCNASVHAQDGLGAKADPGPGDGHNHAGKFAGFGGAVEEQGGDPFVPVVIRLN